MTWRASLVLVALVVACGGSSEGGGGAGGGLPGECQTHFDCESGYTCIAASEYDGPIPNKVEDGVPGVCDARVTPLASSVVGQLVKADVQADPDTDVESLRGKILAACREQLAKHKVPAIIEFCNSFDTTAAGKLARTRE